MNRYDILLKRKIKRRLNLGLHKMFSIFEGLYFVCHPSFWLMNKKLDRNWDKKLNELMSKHKFQLRLEHTACLGEYEIWISNYPYAAFSCYKPKPVREVRPKRKTILKAWKKLNTETYG